MPNRMRSMLLCIALVSGPAFGRDEAAAEHAARAMVFAAEACLIDVKDRKIAYLNSNNCTRRLSMAVEQYVGFEFVRLDYLDQPTIPRHAYIALSAKATALNAAAISNISYGAVSPVQFPW